MEWLFESDTNSIATSRAPGTSRIEGGLYPSKQISAYAKSWTTINWCSRANATTRSMKARSTTWVVGFAGNEMISSFGFGQVRASAVSRLSMKSVWGESGTWRRSPPAKITEYWWIG